MSDESRIFWTREESDPGPRGAARNDKTVLSSGGSLPMPSRTSMRTLFTAHYGRIRDWLTSQAESSGVALVAMSDETVDGAAFLATKEDVVSTAIIGRHTYADLRLRDDETLSLRHVALLLFPAAASGKSARYRLLDLRTAAAFVDERGRRLRALEADGPAFVRLGKYAVMIFPTDESAPWSDDPESSWALIPERLYLDEVETEEKSQQWEADSDRAWEVEDLPAVTEPPTLVHRVAGPEMAVQEFVDEGEPVLGEVLITSSRGVNTVVLGRRAAQSGLLLGQSRRCDAGKVLSNRAISRVHLLMIEIAGTLYAIDTASMNGVWRAEDRERATILESGRTLAMGDVATLEWRPTRP